MNRQSEPFFEKFRLRWIIMQVFSGLILSKSGLVSALLVACGCFSINSVKAQDSNSWSLEDLANVPVVENSKQTDRIFDAPVSAFVFDQGAIENLPVDSVPELLRYATGVHMSRTTNGTWGVAIRGLSSRFISRVLFTVDEQNIYSSLYSGLFGNQHDIFMPDIASVEVVSGPGGVLWGNSAMNGMINVIMKPAFETESGLLEARLGSMNRSVGARTGWAIGDDTSVRVFATYRNRLAGKSEEVDDEWTTQKAGFQLDHRISSSTLLTLSSEVFNSELGWAEEYGDPLTGVFFDQVITERQKGFNVQAKWKHQADQDNGSTMRTWLGYSDMETGYADFKISVVGAEWRTRFNLFDHHKIVFNIGGTLEKNELKDTIYADFNDAGDEISHNAHAGFEYSTQLIHENLHFNVGGLLKNNSKNSDPYFLPTFRILWTPNEQTRIWTSYSEGRRDLQYALNNMRSLQINTYILNPIPVPTPFGIVPVSKAITYLKDNEKIEPEQLQAWEFGIKRIINDRMEYSLVGYHYEMNNLYGASLQSIEPVLNTQEPYFLGGLYAQNLPGGSINGAELSTSITFENGSCFRLGYSLSNTDIHFETNSASDIISALQIADNSYTANTIPAQQISFWWRHGWIKNKILSTVGLRYCSGVEPSGESSIFQADLKLRWHITDRSEISVVGRNLLKDQTTESNLTDMIGYETAQPREWFVEARISF